MARSVSRGSREKLGFISRARGTAVRGEGCGRIEGERLRNIGWLVCAGTSLTELPVSLRFSSVALSSPPLSRAFLHFPRPPPTPGRLPVSLSFTLDHLSLLAPIHGSTFLLLSLLSQPPPQPSFSFSPIRRDGGNCARSTHVLSRTCGSKVFARGGQYSPTTRTIPSHLEKSREGGGGGGSARTAEEIRFYPAAVAETFFPYLGITSKLE